MYVHIGVHQQAGARAGERGGVGMVYGVLCVIVIVTKK